MISRVQIKNFKCYGAPGADFTLKRVNFIFGDNSSGKSTFLQLIRMALDRDTDRIEQDFSRYVFRGDEEREIKLRITALAPRACREAFPVYEYRASRDNQVGLHYVGWVSADEFEKGNRDRIRRKGIDAKRDCLFCEAEQGWIPHVIHAEAARPERLGVVVQKTSLTNEVLLGSDAVAYVNRFFDELNVPYTAISKNELKDKDFLVPVLRRNVGAGIDGLFETALKLYEWRNYKGEVPSGAGKSGAPDGSLGEAGHALLALEEPESHVNERQISPLMNWLFREVNDYANGQIVVECHSELMALKLKNFVRAGVVSPDDLAILFAEKTPEGTYVHEIAMDEKGNYRTKWPNGGFFTARTKVIDEFFKATQTR